MEVLHASRNSIGDIIGAGTALRRCAQWPRLREIDFYYILTGASDLEAFRWKEVPLLALESASLSTVRK